MVSHQGSSFAVDMGHRSATGGGLPCVSVFRRDGNEIVRGADTGFEPADDFCALWHLFDLLLEGAGDWGAYRCLRNAGQALGDPGRQQRVRLRRRMQRVEEQELVLGRTRRAQRAAA